MSQRYVSIEAIEAVLRREVESTTSEEAVVNLYPRMAEAVHALFYELPRRRLPQLCRICKKEPCAASFDNCGGPDCIPF